MFLFYCGAHNTTSKLYPWSELDESFNYYGEEISDTLLLQCNLKICKTQNFLSFLGYVKISEYLTVFLTELDLVYFNFSRNFLYLNLFLKNDLPTWKIDFFMVEAYSL